MATFSFYGQDTASGDVEIVGPATNDELSFYGSTFDSAITVGSYQDSTHVETSGNSDKCSTNHIHNCKYVDSDEVNIDGGGAETLGASAPTEAECTLRIRFNHTSSVETSNGTFWAYDGTTDTAVPTDVTFQAVEQGDTAWTQAEGSGSALSLNDNGTPATDHDFYIACSASPDAVGYQNDFAIKIQLTYQ